MPDIESSWSPVEPALEERALAEAAGPGWSVTLLPTAGSTNAVAAAEPSPRKIVVADHQTAGRGRLDRHWETPPRTALTFSAVVDPGLPDGDWPLLPLATALAVAAAVRRTTQLEPLLKWPNDLLLGDGVLDEGKFAGILLERVAGPAGRPLAVIGIGLNVSMSRDQLPVPTATSLALAGATVDRTVLFGALVQELSETLDRVADDPSDVLDDYREACTTVGRQVEVHLPDGQVFRGQAEGVDEHGHLVVGGRTVGAGDVVHVHPDVT